MNPTEHSTPPTAEGHDLADLLSHLTTVWNDYDGGASWKVEDDGAGNLRLTLELTTDRLCEHGSDDSDWVSDWVSDDSEWVTYAWWFYADTDFAAAVGEAVAFAEALRLYDQDAS